METPSLNTHATTLSVRKVSECMLVSVLIAAVMMTIIKSNDNNNDNDNDDSNTTNDH